MKWALAFATARVLDEKMVFLEIAYILFCYYFIQ